MATLFSAMGGYVLTGSVLGYTPANFSPVTGTVPSGQGWMLFVNGAPSSFLASGAAYNFVYPNTYFIFVSSQIQIANQL